MATCGWTCAPSPRSRNRDAFVGCGARDASFGRRASTDDLVHNNMETMADAIAASLSSASQAKTFLVESRVSGLGTHAGDGAHPRGHAARGELVYHGTVYYSYAQDRTQFPLSLLQCIELPRGTA